MRRSVDTVERRMGHGARSRRNSKTRLKKKRYKVVAVVHAETSTGVLQPLDDIAKLVHEQRRACCWSTP